MRLFSQKEKQHPATISLLMEGFSLLNPVRPMFLTSRLSAIWGPHREPTSFQKKRWRNLPNGISSYVSSTLGDPLKRRRHIFPLMGAKVGCANYAGALRPKGQAAC